MKSTIVNKSVSSLRGSTSTDTNSLALSTEKKRNKLGYHRTSVACGHCRRRKIRCIASPGDRRCSNCIRLKKECNFYPVDQQSSNSGRRDQKGHCTSERKSEEELLTSKKNSQISEISSTLPYPGNHGLPIIQNLGGSQTKHNHLLSSSPNSNKVFRSEHNFHNSNSSATTSSWMGSNTLHMADAAQEVSSYWASNPPKSQLTPNYPPFIPSLQVSPLHDWTTSHTDLSSTEEVPWSVPSRTMSFNNIQGSNSHHLFTSSDSTSLQSTEHHVSKDVPSLPQCSSINPASTIGPTLASMNDNSPHRQLGSMLPLSMSTWQQQYSHQKPTNRSLDQFEHWDENQTDSILMKVESGDETLSPYIYDGFGTG
ncbi:hypothetical protein EPUL_002298, partial [Erysiphe pulchra]